MKKLPLYEEFPQSAAGKTEPVDLDKACTRCSLSQGRGNNGKPPKSICMPAEGEPGGVMLVAEMPGRIEDMVGRPFAGGSGKYLRSLVSKWWKGPVVFDNAVRCMPGKTEVKNPMIDKCRVYTARVVQDASPKRIVCFGSAAIQAILGRRPSILSVRKGYGWHVNEHGKVPVFYTVNPAAALRNRFVQRAFEEDLKWALTTEIPIPTFHKTFTYLVETPADAEEALEALEADQPITRDVETFGFMPNENFRIECSTIWGWNADHGFTFTRKACRDPKVMYIYKRILEMCDLGGQNGKFDDRADLTYVGANVRNPVFDTRLMRKLIEADVDADLDSLAEFVGMGGHKEEAEDRLAIIKKELKYHANPPSGLTPTGKKRHVRDNFLEIEQEVLDQIKYMKLDANKVMAFAFGYVPTPILHRYNARDALSTRNYAKIIKPRVEQDSQASRTWKLIVKDANKAIRWIEHWGIAVDPPAIHAFARHCQFKKQEAFAKLQAHVKEPFNPGSHKQLARVLFEELELPSVRITDSGNESTDKDVLEELKDEHPIIEDLLEYRKYDKRDSTYATGMLKHVRDDGRIHTEFLLDGAGTGRLSSKGPNLQNLPRPKGNTGKPDPDAKMARNIFIARPGYVLLEADFSQLELRIAAMLSGDKAMIEDFKNGIDIHRNGARECAPIVWNISHAKWDSMTKDEQDPMRSKIKTTIFGALYGKLPPGIAKEFGCSVAEIEKIDAKIWGRYHRLKAWTQECLQETRKTGYTWTWWAGKRSRRRPLWKVADQDEGSRGNAERSSWNTPVQGTAADFMTASLWPLVKFARVSKLGHLVVLTVHDSVVQEVPEGKEKIVAKKTKEIMLSHDSMGVPIGVDFKKGVKYGEMEDFKL